jgi:hypothetical protein
MKVLDNYFNILDSIFFKINKSIKDKFNPEKLLNGSVCISGIRSNY